MDLVPPPDSRTNRPADDARQKTNPATNALVVKRRGRRATHTEHWTKATVVLLDREIVFLDRLVADIRGATGTAITRANVIRALVDALAATDVDLTTCRSESELCAVLTKRLRSARE